MSTNPVFWIVVVLLGFIPATIASGKGHSFVAWWLFGVALFVVALPCAIFLKPVMAGGSRPCPYCQASIPALATACSHCTRSVPLGTRTVNCPSCKAPNAVLADLSDWTCGQCGASWSLRKAA